MNESTVNIPLLRKAVEWAEAEAAKPAASSGWLQGHWVLSSRDRATLLAYNEGLSRADSSWATRVAELEHACGTAYCIAGFVGQALDSRYANAQSVDGVHVADFAAAALGLSCEQDAALFDGGNSIEDVRRIAEEIAGERL